MQDLLVTAGLLCSEIGIEVSRRIKAEFHPIVVREFPDGELYVKVPTNVSGRKVILLECAGRRPNSALVESLLTVKTLAKKGAREIILVFPYFPYARQDEEFTPGEAESLKIVAELLNGLGISALITVDMHLHRVKSIDQLFSFKTVNVTAMGELAKYIVKNYPGVSSIIGPDEEAEQWVKPFAEESGLPYLVLRKERRGDEDVKIDGIHQVSGKIVIVDDIISTGSTIVATASLLKSKGVKDIIVACTHGLFMAGAESRILSVGVEDIVTSNSVVNPFARVSVVSPLVEGLEKVVDNE